jgi:hypothetical protein
MPDGFWVSDERWFPSVRFTTMHMKIEQHLGKKRGQFLVLATTPFISSSDGD